MLETESDLAFERTEQRLIEWGMACRQNSQALGLPSISGMAVMIAHVRAETKRKKAARKNILRKARKAWKSGDPPIDAKLVAEEFGYTEENLTAKGKEKRSLSEASLLICSNDMQIDFIVANLANWAKKCIYRSYMYGQADRFAAEDLRMRGAEYTGRRRAAVEQVAIRLAQRYIRPSCETRDSLPVV